MLTRNLWIEKGLCSGTMGNVVHIIYKGGHRPPNLQIVVLVQFYNYCGPTFSTEGLVPIVSIVSLYNTSGICWRSKLSPVLISYVINNSKSYS